MVDILSVVRCIINYYFVRCIPIPEDNTCFSQLSHTYFAPNIFENAEEFQRELRTIIAPLPTTDPCRGFFSSLSCVLGFPSCNNLTKRLQPVCQEICPVIDVLVAKCMQGVNITALPTLNALFSRYNCTDPTSYYLLPPEYIDTKSCSMFSELLVLTIIHYLMPKFWTVVGLNANGLPDTEPETS